VSQVHGKWKPQVQKPGFAGSSVCNLHEEHEFWTSSGAIISQNVLLSQGYITTFLCNEKACDSAEVLKLINFFFMTIKDCVYVLVYYLSCETLYAYQCMIMLSMIFFSSWD
jgi:hypothetical protein